MSVFTEFKSFLTKTNALALAVGVVIGAAIGKVVSAIVADVIMPIVGLMLPGGEWRDSQIVLSRSGDKVNAIKYGDLLGNLIDFTIIAFAIFVITKLLIREKPALAAPTKTCPECLEAIPPAARRCRACTSVQPS
jgi:large conductance mechanosensitive channel